MVRRPMSLLKMVGLSLSAVEKLESGRLKISEAVAQKISFETGVDARWLLDGDPQMPPFLDITAREHLSSDARIIRRLLTRRKSSTVFGRRRLAKESPIREGEHTREEQIICLLFRLALHLLIRSQQWRRGDGPLPSP